MRYRKEFPGVTVVKDRHGKLRYRLRRTVKGRTIDCYLPGVIGSTEFRAAYHEATEGVRAAGRRAQPGTVGYLIEAYLASTAFRNLADRTRADKRWRQDWIKEAIGSARYASIQPRHIEALMSKKGGPAAANRLKKGPLSAVPIRRETIRLPRPKSRRAGGYAQGEVGGLSHLD